MARRYYLSPVIGDGTLNNPYRAAVADTPNASVAAVWASDPATGVPTIPWALCVVAATNHATALADSRHAALPDMLLDARMSALSNSARNRLDSALAKFGVDPATVITNEGYREFVRSVGRLLQATFDENALGVADR